jgi:hypothetical protein
LQDFMYADTKSALPGPTDQGAIEVKPAQKDCLIGKHHQYQPQWSIARTDKLWQSRGKDCASFRVEQIVQESLPEGYSFTKLRRLRSKCRSVGLLVPLEASEQASQAEIPQVCRPDKLTDGESDNWPLKEDSDAEYRRKRPDNASRPDAKGGERSSTPSSKEGIACDQSVSGPGVTISSAATAR